MEKKGVTEVKCVDLIYTWEILNYNLINRDYMFMKYEFDRSLRSPVFSTDHKFKPEWQLQLIPRNPGRVKHPSVGLFAVLSSKIHGMSLLAKIKLSVLGSDGHSKTIYNEVSYFRESEDRAGRYISLVNEEFPTVEDKLIIKCEIRMGTDVIVDKSDTTAVKRQLDLSSTLSQDYETLMKLEKFSDFTLVSSSGKKFPVHRAILSARSPVFAALFEHETCESREKLARIEDVGDEAMLQLLRFVYSGKIDRLQDELAYELLSAADKYALDELKRHCEIALVESLSFENAPSLLGLADLHQAEILKERVLDFIIHKYGRA